MPVMDAGGQKWDWKKDQLRIIHNSAKSPTTPDKWQVSLDGKRKEEWDNGEKNL